MEFDLHLQANRSTYYLNREAPKKYKTNLNFEKFTKEKVTENKKA